MGVPPSEVCYTSATTGRETVKFIRDMWWHWIKKNLKKYLYIELQQMLKIHDAFGKSLSTWARYVDFVVSIKVAVEVCCCFTVFNC
jgi:hypothetical protein